MQEQNGQNVIFVEDDDIGQYTINLSNEQLKVLTKRGANVLANARSAENKGLAIESLPEKRVRRGPSDPMRTVEDGFIGNTIDWGKFFPDNSNVDILIRKAKKFEDDFAIANDALLAFIAAGLVTGFGGATIDGFNKLHIRKIVGSFVDMYGTDV